MILLFWLFFWWRRAWYGKIYFIKCEQKGVWVGKKTKQRTRKYLLQQPTVVKTMLGILAVKSVSKFVYCVICVTRWGERLSTKHIFYQLLNYEWKRQPEELKNRRCTGSKHHRWIIQTILSHVCRQNEMNIWFVISGWSGISHYCHTARPNYHSAFQPTVFSLLTFFCVTFHTSACRRASFEFCFLWNINYPMRGNISDVTTHRSNQRLSSSIDAKWITSIQFAAVVKIRLYFEVPMAPLPISTEEFSDNIVKSYFIFWM